MKRACPASSLLLGRALELPRGQNLSRRPLQKIADNYSRLIDQGFIDKILVGIYRIGGALAGAFAAFDRVVITGFSDTVGRVFRGAGDWGRELQSGQVQNYLLSGLIMALAILVFFLFFFQ